jgi:hypothetical protein
MTSSNKETSKAMASHLRTWLGALCFALLSVLSYGWGVAQEKNEPSAEKLLARAIDQIDSKDIDEQKASINIFQANLGGKFDLIAKCGLALSHFQGGEVSKTLADIEAISRRGLPKELAYSLAKLELCASLAAKDSGVAETRFQQMARAALDEKVETSQRRMCMELGGGLWELLTAAGSVSPIKEEILNQANESMMTCSNASLVQSYQSSRRDARQQVEKIQEWIGRLASQDEPTREQTLKELQQTVSKASKEYEEVSKASEKSAEDQKEVKRTHIINSRKLQNDRLRIQKEPPSAGHPGLPPKPPIEPRYPSKASIRVDEYSYETDKKTGARKRVARDRDDMERERNLKFENEVAKYRIAQQQYLVLKQNYDTAIQTYDAQLTEWNTSEQQRRQDQAKRLSELDVAQKRLDDALEEAEADKKNGTEAFKASREKWDEQREMYRIALSTQAAYQRGEPKTAFLNACLDLISVAQEKQSLKKAIAALGR